ncbi:regulation of enolase protein 1 [Janthinobacterium agaricidamnosum NBRC 102515 = DSM 9628]|uniref:Regulation of enolase protein 1 n=1 Tax=Janthinobacterium agaricidamnosum NBRC 102515 = DSM 9628 TaxID=1349767 RepID=W0V3L5_9BURK|nr:regulation of enolase protein 1 [Janthinobacterium agaricidamnosum NBRC 102515 = DSM 9628]
MFSTCVWLNPPQQSSIDAQGLRVVTDADTDFWRKTQYGFIRDSGHFFGAAVAGDFTAQVHVRGSFKELYDQAGLMVRIDERHWIKAGIEFSDGQMLLSSVLTDEVSDWAMGVAPAMPDGFWLRMTVAGGAMRVQFSADGKVWPLLRLAPFPSARSYQVGPMCCTPQRGGLEVLFSQFSVGPALGKDLHDLS